MEDDETVGNMHLISLSKSHNSEPTIPPSLPCALVDIPYPGTEVALRISLQPLKIMSLSKRKAWDATMQASGHVPTRKTTKRASGEASLDAALTKATDSHVQHCEYVEGSIRHLRMTLVASVTDVDFAEAKAHAQGCTVGATSNDYGMRLLGSYAVVCGWMLDFQEGLYPGVV